MSLLRRIDKGGGNSGGDSGAGGRAPEPAGGAAGGETEESKLAAMRQRRQALAEQQRPGAPGKGNNYLDLKTRVQNKLVSELDHQSMDVSRKNEVRVGRAAAVIDRMSVGFAPGDKFAGFDVHLRRRHATRPQLAQMLVVGFEKDLVVAGHHVSVVANRAKLGVVFP